LLVKYLVIIFLIIAAHLSAQPQSFRVAFLYEDGQQNTINRLHSLVINHFRYTNHHHLTAAEQEALIARARELSLQNLSSQIERLTEQIEQERLVPNRLLTTERDLIRNRRTLERQYNRQLTRPIEVPLPASLPIVLTPPQQLNFAELEDNGRENFELWFYGTSRAVTAQISFIEYFVYNSLTQETITLFSNPVRVIELEEAALQITANAMAVLMGQEPAAVILNNLTTGAELFLNDEWVTVTRLLYLPAGNYHLLIRRAGFYDRHFNLNLTTGQQHSIEGELQPRQQVTISIETNPAEAQIFLNGLLIGRSPLTFTANTGEQVVIQSIGYINQSFTVREDAQFIFTLLPISGDTQLFFDRSQRYFLISLTSFTASLASSLVFLSLAEIAGERAMNSFDPHEREAQLRRASLYSGLGWGSVGLAGVSFTFTIVNLNRYIRAGNRITGVN